MRTLIKLLRISTIGALTLALFACDDNKTQGANTGTPQNTNSQFSSKNGTGGGTNQILGTWISCTGQPGAYTKSTVSISRSQMQPAPQTSQTTAPSQGTLSASTQDQLFQDQLCTAPLKQPSSTITSSAQISGNTITFCAMQSPQCVTYNYQVAGKTLTLIQQGSQIPMTYMKQGI